MVEYIVATLGIAGVALVTVCFVAWCAIKGMLKYLSRKEETRFESEMHKDVEQFKLQQQKSLDDMQRNHEKQLAIMQADYNKELERVKSIEANILRREYVLLDKEIEAIVALIPNLIKFSATVEACANTIISVGNRMPQEEVSGYFSRLHEVENEQRLKFLEYVIFLQDDFRFTVDTHIVAASTFITSLEKKQIDSNALHRFKEENEKRVAYFTQHIASMRLVSAVKDS